MHPDRNLACCNVFLYRYIAWVGLQVLLSATEAAEMILRVDDIIRCAPRQRQG
jgi:hypothetical protein